MNARKAIKAPPREPDARAPKDSWFTTAIMAIAIIAGFMAWMVVWPTL